MLLSTALKRHLGSHGRPQRSRDGPMPTKRAEANILKSLLTAFGAGDGLKGFDTQRFVRHPTTVHFGR